jgi:hypothetical protein
VQEQELEDSERPTTLPAEHGANAEVLVAKIDDCGCLRHLVDLLAERNGLGASKGSPALVADARQEET